MGNQPEVLLVLMAWDLPSWFTEKLPVTSPGIELIVHRTIRGATEVPDDIPQDVWDRVTVLFTWNEVPPIEKAPRLQYVQLLSAGCNHMIGKPIFDKTDVAFCTANGVHPYDTILPRRSLDIRLTPWQPTDSGMGHCYLS